MNAVNPTGGDIAHRIIPHGIGQARHTGIVPHQHQLVDFIIHLFDYTDHSPFTGSVHGFSVDNIFKGVIDPGCDNPGGRGGPVCRAGQDQIR